MRRLQCQSCGASLTWDGQSEVVTCGSCGMSYLMRSQDPRRNVVRDALKGGCVAPRPAREGNGFGPVYFDSWLPEGWTYQYETPDIFFRYTSVATPFVPTFLMYTEDMRRLISYVPANFYVDAPGSPMGMPAMGGGLLAGLMDAFAAQAGGGGRPKLAGKVHVRTQTAPSLRGSDL